MTLGSLFLSSFLALSAHAQDPKDELDLDDLEDITFDDDAPEAKAKPALENPQEEETAPETPEEEDEAILNFEDSQDDRVDLLEGEVPELVESGDTEALYRDTERRLSKLDNDEEITEWERYLAQYPNTVFRKRIELRIEALTDQLYDTRIDSGDKNIDAMAQEIGFAQAILLENIDPRDRIQAAFEWGFPTYLNLVLDYEAQLTRKFSVHGGVRRRYQGVNVELGGRWAIVKSTRTDTLVTFIGDVRLNMNPFFPAARPQLAFGKRLGKVDVQAQGGVDLELRSRPLGTGGSATTLETKIIGGANLFYLASERVGLFAEVGVFMKPRPEEPGFTGGLFAFNTATVGLKFFPSNKNKPDARDSEVNIGGTVPVMQNWWQFHFGSFGGQFNYYL